MSASRKNRKTSFGCMSQYAIASELMGSFELMHFEKPGKAHQHCAEELALCVEGHGEVLVADLKEPKKFQHVAVGIGDTVLIPANCPHYMVPAGGRVLGMVILYLA